MTADFDRRRQLIASISHFNAGTSNSDEDLKQFKRELKSFIDVRTDDGLQELSTNRLIILGLLKLVNAQEASRAKFQARTLRALANALGVSEGATVKEIFAQFATRLGISDSDNIGDAIHTLTRAIPRVAAEFGLTGNFDASSIPELCNSIRRKCRKDLGQSGFIREAATVLGLPGTASEDEVLRSLKASKERMDSVEDEVSEMKHTIAELRKQLRQIRADGEEKLRKSMEKVKKANSQLKQQVKEADAETGRWKDKCRDLEVRVEACESERADLEERNIAMRNQLTKTEQTETADFGNIMNLAEQLKTQFENQSEELMEEATARKKLVEIVNKQCALVKAYEEQVRQATREVDAAKREAAVLAEQAVAARREESAVAADSLREAVLGAVAHAPADINDMVCAAMERSGGGSISDRVADVIATLIDELIHVFRQKDELEKCVAPGDLVGRLMGALNAQLKFMNRLVECDDERKLVVGQSNEQKAKDMLLVEVARAHKFMEENCEGIIEDHSIFDILKMDRDPMELQASMREFLEKYEDMTTNEGKELLILLRQAFVVVTILIKFALEAKKQCGVQLREIRVLRQEITANHETYIHDLDEKNAEFEETLNAEVEKREAAEAVVRDVTAVLKSSAMKSGNLTEVLEAIDTLGNFGQREVNEEAYGKSIERRLATALNDLAQAQSELTELKEKTTCELSQFEEESKGIKEETQTLIADKNEEIEKYKVQLDNLNRKLKRRKEEVRRLQEENKDQAAMMNDLKATYAKKSAQMREEFTKVKQEMAAMLEKTTAEITSKERKKRELLKQKLKKAKEVTDSLSTLVEEKDEQLKSVSSVNSQLVNDKKSKAEERRTMETEYQQSITTMKEQLRQASTKIVSIELENKLLVSKLRTAEKRLAQEKAVLESQHSLNLFGLEGDFHKSTAEDLREQFDEERLAFLREINRSLAEVSSDIDNLDESAVLRAVNQTVDTIRRLQNEKLGIERELREVRRALNCPKGVNPAEMVFHLNEHVRAAELKIQRLNTEIQGLPRIQIHRTEDRGKEKEWEDWARNLYLSVTDGLPSVASFAAMRTAIEEAALSSEKISTSRRLDSLRVQKSLLQGNDLSRKDQSELSMRELSLAVLACRRILRMAGLVPSGLTIEKVESPTNAPSPVVVRSPAPLFSSFVE